MNNQTSTLIKLTDIKKSFDTETVLNGIDLDIRDKEFITLLGPSGCGKTTTLRIIGGFETPDTGDVYFDGKRINDLPPYERQIGRSTRLNSSHPRISRMPSSA